MEPFNLTSLPAELVDKVVYHVSQRSDLATLRLTSKTLNAISTPYYFATVPVYPEWKERDEEEGIRPYPNQVEYHARYLASILTDMRLNVLVRKLDIYLCNPNCVSVET